MGSITYEDIVSYRNTIDTYRANYNLLIDNYKTNVGTIKSNISNISFTEWEDDIATDFSDYKDLLNNGIIGKLSSSIGTEGSLRKLIELVNSLYDQCDAYIKNIGLIKEKESSFTLDSTGGFSSSDDSFSESLSEINRTLSGDRDTISNTLTELQSLKFDSIVDFNTSYVRINSLADYQITSSTPEPVIINQYDLVLVTIEVVTDEEYDSYRDTYQETLNRIQEYSNGQIYIREVSERTQDSYDYSNINLRYYTNPWDFLRGLCELYDEDINDYIDANGNITRAGYERIIDYNIGRFGQDSRLDDIIFVDPDEIYKQDFIASGALPVDALSMYDRFTTVRCYETIEEFEADLLDGNDEQVINMFIASIPKGGRNTYNTMLSLGVVGNQGQMPTKEMYYLGTDSKGRSYFSESLDKNAKAYRTQIPGVATTAQTYLNSSEAYTMPGYAEARIGFVIMGGNTNDMTVGNVLEKWGGTYANGFYVDDTNFNNSIVFDDPSIAPTIVERGTSQYDYANAYHVKNIDYNECIPLSDILSSSDKFNTSEHPDIILNPGDKITSTYNIRLGDWEWFFGWDTYTIGDDENTYVLTWDPDREAYYVVDGSGTYYTANHNMGEGTEGGRGRSYIRLDKLKDSDTKFYINGKVVKVK